MAIVDPRWGEHHRSLKARHACFAKLRLPLAKNPVSVHDGLSMQPNPEG